MHFKVHPSVLFQLGESLITDVVQAVVELVKNAYDADATRAEVRIETTGGEMPAWSKYKSETAWIEVADNGTGMNRNDIETKWFMVSNRSKLEQKGRRELTERGRTPLGDKGLGRLGVQRLGHRVELLTKAKDEDSTYIGIDWRAFIGKSDLASVEIQPTKGSKKQRGTQILVSALHNASDWSGQGAQRLEDELTRILSPYRKVKDFTVTASVNGRDLELGDVGEEIERLSRIHYTIDFDGMSLRLHAKARLDFLRPRQQDREQWAAFAALVDADHGKGLMGFLMGLPLAKGLSVKPARDRGWFVESLRSVELTEVDKLEVVGDAPANPGPFQGEVDAFDLGANTQDEIGQSSTFDSFAQYKLYVRKFSGIRVFRDGFGVKMPEDWTGLGKQWTRGSSWYGLKPANTIGYLAISARDNAALEETTDREGFKDTPHYRNLLGLLTEWRRYSDELHEFLRRGWVAYSKSHQDRLAGLQHEEAIEDVSSKLRERVKTASRGVKAAKATMEHLHKQVTHAERALDSAARSLERGDTSEKVPKQLREGIRALKDLVEQAKQVQVDLAEAADLDALEALGASVDERVKSFREQLRDVYHAVAVGLSAEALTHELHTVTERLIREARTSRGRLKSSSSPAMFGEFIESVLSAATAIRKQLAHVQPTLKYVREQRDVFQLSAFLTDFTLFHHERLAAKGIGVKCSAPKSSDVSIRMNKGKLTQVLDNLVFNSEYWLGEASSKRTTVASEIIIVADDGKITLSDNGPGINPAVEQSLFEPFVTTKRAFEGRGLGLYICKQLLDSDGCSIRLSDRRNGQGRRFEFVIDLVGVRNA